MNLTTLSAYSCAGQHYCAGQERRSGRVRGRKSGKSLQPVSPVPPGRKPPLGQGLFYTTTRNRLDCHHCALRPRRPGAGDGWTNCPRSTPGPADRSDCPVPVWTICPNAWQATAGQFVHGQLLNLPHCPDPPAPFLDTWESRPGGVRTFCPEQPRWCHARPSLGHQREVRRQVHSQRPSWPLLLLLLSRSSTVGRDTSEYPDIQRATERGAAPYLPVHS
jgi:hypothetical protein